MRSSTRARCSRSDAAHDRPQPHHARPLERTAVHADLGQVTLDEMLHEWVGHDLGHTVQAERALMQPFIAGSGPWRSFFEDHDVEAKEG